MISFSDNFFRSEVLAPEEQGESASASSSPRPRPSVRSAERLRFNPSGVLASASVISMLVAAQLALPLLPLAGNTAAFTRDLGSVVLETKEPSAVAKKAAAIWNGPRSSAKSERPIGELLAAIRSSIT